MSRKPVALHPLLFALAPILFLYSHNAAKLPIAPRELLLPLAMSFAVALVLWLLLWLVLRSSRRAALVVSLFLVLFFLYGRVHGALGHRTPAVLLPVISAATLLLGIIVFSRPRREFSGLTVFLNLASLALVLINLLTTVPAVLHGGRTVSRARETARAESAGLPDIYYVILDAHAREDVLRNVYNCDDSSFIRWLTENGFHVAAAGRSNYSQTYLSLASSLNMTMLDSVARQTGIESDNRTPLVHMIADNLVMKTLRQHGYKIASFASGYTGTGFDRADFHFALSGALSEFQNVLISTTPLPLILDRLLHRSQYDIHRAEVLYALEHLPDAARLPHPVFVFAHIVSPHPPFVFGPHGEKINPKGFFTMTEGGEFGTIDKEEVRRDYIAGYRDQVTFLDGKLQEMVQRILNASPQPPVIILQGDHGPGSMLNWDDPEPDELAERFAIFNAYHIPGGDSLVYDSITPVNTFRLLFNHLLGTDYQYLPDKSWFSSIARPWHFYDADNPAEYMKSHAGPKVSVVAFRTGTPPEDQGAYCRRLVAMQYPGATVSIDRFYVQGSGEPLKDTAEAYQLYRSAVAKKELPDLGTDYKSYSGPGPDRSPVIALFFSADR